jgi:hypothetical protein
MQKGLGTLVAISSALIFTACQKEISGPQDNTSTQQKIDLEGNYKFVALEANINVSNEITDGSDVLKVITVTDYRSQNNAGTVKLDPTTITLTDITYSIDTTFKVYNYLNGALTDSLESPLQITVPSSSYSSSFNRISNDSLYFPSGFITLNNTPLPSTGAGVKLHTAGNLLYMNLNQSQEGVQDQGIPVHVTFNLKMRLTLQKM